VLTHASDVLQMLEIQDMTVQQYCHLLHGNYLALLHGLTSADWDGMPPADQKKLPAIAFAYIHSHLEHAGWLYANPYQGWVLSHNTLVLYTFTITESKARIWRAHSSTMRALQREIVLLGAEWDMAYGWHFRSTTMNLPKGEVQVIELRLRHILAR
jgi:hypothetical protein